MKILVTGATGMLGRNISRVFLETKNFEEVIVLGRNKERLDDLKEIGATPISFDLTANYENFSALDAYKDAVWVNCAAAITGADDKTLHEVNVVGTEKLIKKASELDVRFIHISSYTVYGIDGSQYTENSPYDPGTRYATSKIESEKLIFESKLRWTMLRPPYIVSPDDTNVLYQFARRIENHKMPMVGREGKVTILDARDMGHAIIGIIDNNETVGEIYNIHSDVMDYSKFINLFGDKLGKGKPYGKNYPYSLVYTLGFFLDMFYKIQGKSNEASISRYRIRSLASDRTIDISKLRKAIDYTPKYTTEQSLDDWITNR